MNKINFPWAEKTQLSWSESENSYLVTIDASIYSLNAVLKTCYLFLDQCYLFVERSSVEAADKIKIYFSALEESENLDQVIGEFSNRLVWQEVRQKVAEETQSIREMIVAQAFTEGNLLELPLTEADYNNDPLGIGE